MFFCNHSNDNNCKQITTSPDRLINIYLFRVMSIEQNLFMLIVVHQIDKLLIMSSERQLQDRGNSNQDDSLGIQDARQVADPAIVPISSKDLDSQDDREHLQRIDLLTKKLKEKLNSADTNATVE